MQGQTNFRNRCALTVDGGWHYQMRHKFHIRPAQLWPKVGSPNTGPLVVLTKILKQLPEREGELQYRIKNAAEEHQRIAFESELRAF